MLSQTEYGRFPIKAEILRKQVDKISSNEEKKLLKKGTSWVAIHPAETNINNPDNGTA